MFCSCILFLRDSLKKIIKYLLRKNNKVLCKITDGLNKEQYKFIFDHYDYIRVSSLVLIANEIYDKNILGNVAELGVFKGNFAGIINRVFPDKKLYLFDTFEGFDKRDIKIEVENNYSN